MDWGAIWDKCLDVLLNGGWLLLKLVFIFVIGYILIRIAKKFIRYLLNKTSFESLAKRFIVNAISFVLYFLLLLTLIQSAGIEITGIITAIAAVGLAIALALKDSLTSLANGLILIINKPFKENDSVDIDGISGKVKEIRFFTTIIDTWDNRRVVLPNKDVLNCTIINNNYHPLRRFSVNFEVNVNTDFKKLKKIVLDTILSNSEVFTNPEPACQLKEIGPESLKIEARGWANSEDTDSVAVSVREAILNELKRNGIDFKINKMVVYLEQKPEEVNFDLAPLPERDVTQNPKIKKEVDKTFEERMDERRRQGIEKYREKKKARKKKTQKED